MMVHMRSSQAKPVGGLDPNPDPNSDPLSLVHFNLDLDLDLDNPGAKAVGGVACVAMKAKVLALLSQSMGGARAHHCWHSESRTSGVRRSCAPTKLMQWHHR